MTGRRTNSPAIDPPEPGGVPDGDLASASRDRFEIGDLLGQGGMGRVFRAYDTRLRRPVALKFLRGAEPEQVSRFLREAQAQARVDHDNVCRIYEVGERDGKPYIAMQYIEGAPLFVGDGTGTGPGAALQQMTVDQKVRMMQRVAEGIQAAHREGLIHRDIKPSNVMLERTEDGDWKPYVLDFGLAREVASASVTSLGLAAGTPNFMAPEQARGELGALDRRTDVYGLGATLYAVLAGRPPFEGPSSLDVLVKVTEDDPPALTAVPADLAAIVAKCLEKEPAHRYESARALAEDLGRYLDGEPIRARRTSLAYRLARRARKHRKLVAAASLAAAAFLVLGIASLRAQLRAQERARLAGVFGQEVKALESLMRVAYLVPEHDVRGDRAAVRERMAALAERVGRLGAVAQGPGHYAVGRGHLALREYAEARAELERAWQSGYREPEVAYALGQALGALYQSELAAANRISDARHREEREKRAEREYRDPALDYLRRGRGVSLDSTEYAEALVAFYEKNYERAAAQARAAHRRLPWLYEARELEGRIHAALAMEKAQRGDLAAARRSYAEAEAAFGAAQEVGRSDARIPAGMCTLAYSLMQVELYTAGGRVEPYFEKGMAACEKALRTDPEEVEAYHGKVELLWRLAESRFRQGGETGTILDQAVEVGRQALRLDPDDPKLLQRVATAHTVRAQFAGEAGIDPRPSLRECISLAEHALRIDPRDHQIQTVTASCYDLLAVDLARRGEEADAAFEKAIQHIEEAAALRQEDIILCNRGVLYIDRSTYEFGRGRDPMRLLERAHGSLDAAEKVNPRFVLTHLNRASAALLEAQYRLAVDQDPRPALDRSRGALEAVLAINPESHGALADLANAAGLRAQYDLEQGGDPSAPLAEGRRWVVRSRAMVPGNGAALLAASRLDLIEGRWQAAAGTAAARGRAAALAARAVDSLEQGLRRGAATVEAQLLTAEALWRRVEWGQDGGGTHAPGLARALALVDQAEAESPREARASALRGALLLQRSRLAPRRRAEDRARARSELERALSMNGLLEREFGGLMERTRAD